MKEIELTTYTHILDLAKEPNTLLVTTSHSFKGYDAEIVLIPCADQYTTQDGQILAANLYVAMTRARSLLGIYTLNSSDLAARTLNAALDRCITDLNSPPVVDSEGDRGEDEP